VRSLFLSFFLHPIPTYKELAGSSLFPLLLRPSPSPPVQPFCGFDGLQYDDLTGLARTFESHLLTHHLLDTRLPPTASEDSTETISAVLSNWSTSILSGVRETAGVVYTGVGEYAGQAQEEVKREGVWGSFKKLGEGVKGVVLGPGEKGKGRAQGEPRQGEEGWKDVVGESIRSSG
jgi:hypothetical protein